MRERSRRSSCGREKIVNGAYHPQEDQRLGDSEAPEKMNVLFRKSASRTRESACDQKP